MRKNLRYLILLLVLLFVAVNEALIKSRSTSWENPLWVRIYAVNGDGRNATEKYIDSLTRNSFAAVEKFVNSEARRHGVLIDAIDVEYNGRLQSGPPELPAEQSVLGNIWWSLRFRAWAAHRAWNSDQDEGDVELFVTYYDIETTHSLRHSVGLEGGLIGIINAFADKSYRGSNQVVIAHELMHTLGASDKYAMDSIPQYPQGYAEPYLKPLYPQRRAEIMGGRIPLSAQQAVGIQTAAEINWPIDR
jgi:hypothetical protein